MRIEFIDIAPWSDMWCGYTACLTDIHLIFYDILIYSVSIRGKRCTGSDKNNWQQRNNKEEKTAPAVFFDAWKGGWSAEEKEEKICGKEI
ncbi:MAG: hypothetical protein IKZ75_04385 [Oscillospiraceae bacterium]|nr:hypothetical protein [Oscillospiraceae bacterium]